MKILNCILFHLLVLSTTFAQDGYHSWLLNQLENEYGLNGGTFVLGDNEDDKFDAFNHFNGGALTPEQRMTVSEKNITNQPFTKAFELLTPTRLPDGKNTLVGSKIKNQQNINEGDTLLLVFWAKGVSDFFGFNGMAKVSVKCDHSDCDGIDEMYKRISYFNDEWTQYLMPMKANSNFDPGELSFFFSFGYRAQTVQYGGVALINYGPSVSLSRIPDKLGPNAYQGISADASWRAPAQNRIENFRKANLKVNVVDENNIPINGAVVEVDMNQHHFGFGTAVNLKYPLYSYNNPVAIKYWEKIFDLDGPENGPGHGFNEVVFENAMEWKKWEIDIPIDKEEKVEVLDYLIDRGIKVRGHSLLWPRFDRLPDDMEENRENPSFLKDEIRNHIKSILKNEDLQGKFIDWDAINEITNKRDIERSLAEVEGRDGRAFYDEILELAKEYAPNTPMYLNDYMTISYGGIGEKYDSCKNFLKEIYDAGAPFDGIGFQAHLREAPIGIPTVYSILEDFNQTFNEEKDFKITEFDMRSTDDSILEQYTRDFLTICFSHEKVKSFITWGFWDGEHWKQNAPFFKENWDLKPSGKAFIDLVFDEWWTNEQDNTNNAGRATFRPFKGKHTIKATYGGVSEDYEVDLTEDGEITIVLPISASEPGLLGDADCDGDVDAVDALAILQYTVGIRSGLTSCPLENQTTQINIELADVNNRDGASAVDALFILQCVVGIENVLCPN